MYRAVSFRPATLRRRFCAIAGLVAIAMLGACATHKVVQAPVVATPAAPPPPPAPHQLSQEAPDFLRLPANSMLKAAQLALFDAGKSDILLMTADDSGTPADAAAAAQKLLSQGA